MTISDQYRTYQLHFFVPGAPAPQGSKRSVGHGIMIESSKAVGPWRERVALAAHNLVVEQRERAERYNEPLPLPFVQPIEATFKFVLPRPKSEPRRTRLHTRKPDLDKLVRAVCDALTNIVYVDDAQIVRYGEGTGKRTAELNEQAGVHITIGTLL